MPEVFLTYRNCYRFFPHILLRCSVKLADVHLFFAKKKKKEEEKSETGTFKSKESLLSSQELKISEYINMQIFFSSSLTAG